MNEVKRVSTKEKLFTIELEKIQTVELYINAETLDEALNKIKTDEFSLEEENVISEHYDTGNYELIDVEEVK
ncbi:hypothetical protein [Clostridium sardiniense]|uniref:hypothetical protein n=1 Tax=Clostridium sardiniense TaxID=29369 RepID=UPI001957D585|nr:hypothetical protein [Clostridium sardiniense]MBM7835922.1 hypothetical protein [Clostridium sardiniense]